MIETKIYVGLNDADTKQQKFEIDRYVTVLKRVCVEYGIPFSFDLQQGGYLHEDGTYTEEQSIVLTFIDVAPETIEEVAKDLCVFFNQESVLITKGQIEAFFIKESI
ncbi:MAG: hypothetical protein IJ781_00540 [Atopobiaceae bacterium]|nr:hypothetical protein [Atopobiaceae bacterium]